MLEPNTSKHAHIIPYIQIYHVAVAIVVGSGRGYAMVCMTSERQAVAQLQLPYQIYEYVNFN